MFSRLLGRWTRRFRASGRHRGSHVDGPLGASPEVPRAREESVELVFRDGTRVRLPEVEAAAFRRLAGDLKRSDAPTAGPGIGSR